MKVKDIFTDKFYEEHGDIDVYQDCLDIDGIAYCGNKLTKQGKAHYKHLLNLNCKIGKAWGYPCVWVLVNGEQNDEQLAKDVMGMFYDMAGYCTEEEYDKWFVERSIEQ